LGPLSKKVKDTQVQEIVDTLCNHLLSEKKGADELRDISSIGLKTVITEIPIDNTPLASILIKRLTPRLISGISENVSLIILCNITLLPGKKTRNNWILLRSS
jgi:cullin-associated NEDD8-dissociated protein 1